MSNKINIVESAYKKVDADVSALYMAQLLMDDENSTYKMFEELASLYIGATDEQREAIDSTCSILTGWKLTSIAETLLKN